MELEPTVWFVDDLPENLEKFRRNHNDDFKIRTFKNINEVIGALKSETPDALLCDIFFYENLVDGRKVENRIKDDVKKLKETIVEFDLQNEKHHDGIKLIEEVNSQYNQNQTEPPFPIYAYTSKGPYIFNTEMLSRLENAGAKILYKGRMSKDLETYIIKRDIEDLKLNISSNTENKESTTNNVHVMPHWTQFSKPKKDIWKFTNPFYYICIIIRAPFKSKSWRIIYSILGIIALIIGLLSADYKAIESNLQIILPWLKLSEKTLCKAKPSEVTSHINDPTVQSDTNRMRILSDKSRAVDDSIIKSFEPISLNIIYDVQKDSVDKILDSIRSAFNLRFPDQFEFDKDEVEWPDRIFFRVAPEAIGGRYRTEYNIDPILAWRYFPVFKLSNTDYRIIAFISKDAASQIHNLNGCDENKVRLLPNYLSGFESIVIIPRNRITGIETHVMRPVETGPLKTVLAKIK